MNAKILIVDDDPDLREALSSFLKLEGYQIATAIDGIEAMHQVLREQPDLILLDVSMPPGPDGYEVCRQIKGDQRTAHIPVTFLTYQGALDERKRGIEVGASDYLSKPVNFDVLEEHVRSQLIVRKQPKQFETAESVLFTLAQTAEAKDAYTTGHLRRMEYYSRRLAMAVGVKGQDLQAIRYGAILHDVGKLRISEAILTKPGPLTPEEFAVLKSHPEHGAQMISHLRFADKVTPIVLGHHEKWNGRGYPHNLSGEDIPLGARIVAIADAYDAMTTDRPYRRALPQQEALRRLQNRSGDQWDPKLAPLFCTLMAQETDTSEALGKAPPNLIPVLVT
jgi:putative two-component system response regulator